MALIHIFFWTCVIVVGQSLYYSIQLLRGRPPRGRNGKPLPAWVWVTFLGVGALGIAGSAPALFFDRPHWFTDKIFSAVDGLIHRLGG